jgi:hypothetical protein
MQDTTQSDQITAEGSGTGSSRFPNGATSAIPGMSVGEMRQHLHQLRTQWKQRTGANPFLITTKLESTSSRNLTMEEFAVKFVLGHHLKRYRKS